MRTENMKREELAYGTIHVQDAEKAKKEEMQRKLALLNKSKAYKEELQRQME